MACAIGGSTFVNKTFQYYNAVQNGWETPEKNLTNWRSPVLTKLKLSLCSISPSPPNQCWLAIIHNNMDWQHGNIGLGGRGDYCMSSWACIFRIEAAISQLVLHAIVVCGRKLFCHEFTASILWLVLQVGCVIAASCIQYLFLVVFCSMLIEGVQLYRKVTSVFAVHLNLPLCYLFSWGM